jgi:hypothetical protein
MIIKQYTTENGIKPQIKDMEEEFKFGLMEADMKVIGKTTKRIF